MSAEAVRGILPLHALVAPEENHPPQPWICGFAAMGDRNFPVVDLGVKLGFEQRLRGREPLIVVVETKGRLAGFIAERVSEVIDLRQKDFRSGAVRGRGRTRKVLDPEELLRTEEIDLSP